MTPSPLRAVVVPYPPLLFAELTGAGAADAEPVRRAVARALTDLMAGPLAAGRPLVVVGSGAVTREHPAGAWGTLAGLGVALEAPAAGDEPRVVPPSLPLSLTVGCLLLDLVAASARGTAPRSAALVEVAADASTPECGELGADVARRHPEAAWLVIGDGTTKRTPRAPGSFDERAEPFDAAAVAALATGQPEDVLALDTATAAELGAAGRAAWQVLAGGWQQLHPHRAAVASVDDLGAPFGVGYLVARWCDPT